MGELEEKFNKPEESISIETPKDAKNEKPEGLKHNPELLAGKNIQEMKKRAEGLGLEKSEKLLFDGTDSAELNPQIQKAVLEKNGIIERLRMISEKVGELFEDASEKILNYEEVPKAGVFEDPKKAKQEYEKRIETIPVSTQEAERRDLLKNLEINSAQDLERILNGLREHINSDEYLNKLRIEFDGNLEEARRAQKRRATYLNCIKFSFLDSGEIKREFIRGNLNQSSWMPEWLAVEIELFKSDFEVGGFYNTDNHKITLPIEREDDTVGAHELFHASTRGDYDISDSAKEILSSAYKKTGNKEKDEYLSTITEMLVRKQRLDLEMERLGIKKYGEKFTNEHYKKIVEYYEKGAFSYDVNNFIETTKPEYFEKIFNEIAENEKGEYAEVVQA